MLMDHSEEGVKYSIPAKNLQRVNHGTTLSELIQMVYHKVVGEGENAELKLTCRFPVSQYGAVINYMAISIEDDSMLEKVLDIPSLFQGLRCVEVYIEKKIHHAVGFSNPGPQSIQYGLYTRLLTQGSEESPHLSPMNLNEDYSHNYDGYGRSHCSEADEFYNNQYEVPVNIGPSCRTPTFEAAGPSCRTPNFERNYEFNSWNPRESMPTDEGDINPVERLVRFQDNTGDVNADSADLEHAEDPLEEAEDEAEAESDGEETTIGGSDSDEECGRVGSEGVAMPSPPHVHEPHRPVPFLTDLEGNEGCEVTSRDSYRTFPMWDYDKVELTKSMTFKDKLQLQEAVKFYHTKNDREYVVVETNPRLWVVKCKNGCTWRLRASKKGLTGGFQITQYNGNHHCVYPHTS